MTLLCKTGRAEIAGFSPVVEAEDTAFLRMRLTADGLAAPRIVKGLEEEPEIRVAS